jgi:hypothetical protein
LRLDQVADPHFDTSGVQASELCKSIYRGASICLKDERRKEESMENTRNPVRIGL